jgi:hypothetical protein
MGSVSRVGSEFAPAGDGEDEDRAGQGACRGAKIARENLNSRILLEGARWNECAFGRE